MKRAITYANVVSTLALVLALGTGGAYAVDKIGSSDVRNDSLRSDDLKNGSGGQGQRCEEGCAHREAGA